MIRNRTLYEQTPALLQAVDSEGRIIAVSNRWLTWSGYSREEVIGRTWQSFLAASSSNEIASDLPNEYWPIESVQDERVRFQTQYGHIVDVSLTINAVPATDDDPAYWLAVLTEITNQKRTVAALHDSENRFRLYERIIAANPDPVCLIDAHYTYQLVNPAFQRWSSRSDLVGKHVVEYVGEDFFGQVIKPRVDQALAGETQNFEEWAYDPNRQEAQFISITYAPYYETDGTISGVINSIRDLTALKRTRDRLAKTHEQLRFHIHNSPLAVIEWDHQKRVKQWSPQAEKIFGWSGTDVIDHHISELNLFPPDRFGDIDDYLKDLLNSETHHQTRLVQNLTREGTEIYCEWYNSALVDDRGNLVSVLSLVQNVTARQRAQMALRESEERWQLALLGSNEGIWDWKMVTNELFCSPRCKALLGFADQELPSTYEAWLSRIHPDDQALMLNAMEAHLSGETPNFSVEYRMQHQAGQYVWILSRGQAIFDATNQPVRFVGSHTDVSDRKQAELALRSSQQFLQLAFDNMPQRVFWKDCEGRFLGCNQAFAIDMARTTPAEIVGKTDEEVLPLTPHSRQHFTAHDDEVLVADRAILREEQTHHYQDGTTRWVSITKLPLKSAKGDLLGIFGCYEDVTERVLAQESLQRYARMVEAAKDAICLIDTDFRYQIINPTYQAWYGNHDHSILGQTVADVVGQATFDHCLKPLLKRGLNGETIRHADWFELPRLGRRFCSLTLTPYTEDSGHSTGILISIRDLTALKESKLRQQQLLEIIEATPNFVSMVSVDGDVVYVNPALRNLIPRNVDSGQPVNHLHQHYPKWALGKIINEAIPTATAQGTWQGETALLTWDGQEIPVAQTVTIHFDEQGEVKLLSMIASDIRRQKELEQELRDRLKNERLLSRISAEFISLPNHDLVNGVTQALQDIAESTGADRSYVYLLSDDQQFGYLASQWQAPELSPILEEWQTLPTASLQGWITQLQERQVVVINDTDEMPPEAWHERRVTKAIKARSMVVVPMHHSGCLMGYIGFSLTHPKVWSRTEITLLRLVGDLFANTYQRQQVEDALRRQEHYFRSLTERASDIVLLLDETGRCQYITPSVTRLLGYSPDELFGRPLTNFVAAEDAETLIQTLENAAAQPGVSQPHSQYRVRHQNQQWRYFEAIATSLLQDPVVGGIVVNCRDVSDRVLAETARHRSEQVFKAIFEQSAISMAQIALDGTYIQVNPAFCQLVGYTAEALIGEHYAKVTHPEDLTHDIILSDQVAEGKANAQFIDQRFICADSSVRHVQAVVTAVHDDQGSPAFLASVYNNVTDQVIAENSLRSIVEGTASVVGEAFFPVLAGQLANSLAVDHILITELKNDGHLTTLVFWSHQSPQPLFSYHSVETPCELAMAHGVYCCPERVQSVFPQDLDLQVLEAESYLGVALKGQDGQVLGVLCVLHSQPIHNIDNAVALLRIFAARASAELERQQSSRALKANETNWRNIINNMPVLLNAIDENGQVILWNKECERVTGYPAEEIIGDPKALSQLYPDEAYRRELQKAWRTRGGNYRDWEWAVTCKDGRERMIAWSNLSDVFPIPDLGSWGVGVDMTERRQAEQALRESEARFQRLAANMPGIIYRYYLSADGCEQLTYLSPACREIWEREPEAALQDIDIMWDLVHSEDRERLRNAYLHSRAHLTPLGEDYRIVTPSNQLKWVKVVARPVCEPDGGCLWDGIMIDVTKQHVTQEALQASEALNRAILEALPDLLVRMRRDGLCLDVQYPSYFDVVCSQVRQIGCTIHDTLPPKVAQQYLLATRRALNTNETQIHEYELPLTGVTRWEEARVVPMSQDEVLILVRDIDERRRAENEVYRLNQVLERQNQRLEELVELRTAELLTFMNALPDQIFVIDRATNRLTFGNDGVVQFADMRLRQDFEGKTVFDCFAPDRATYYNNQNYQVFESGEILHIEEAMEVADGLVHLDTYKIPLKRADGEVYALIGTSRNITELVKARQTLETQALQLEATNQELQSFSYSVSHDLRAPLRHINGFIAALKQRLEHTMPTPDAKAAHYIDVIEHSSQKMGLLIDGLLTLSRVGRRDMVMRPVALAPLVEHAIALIEGLPENAPNQVQITLDALPTVLGDSTLLQQVFTNLVGNAVKFSRGRTPAIIHIGQRVSDGAIFVRDNGVGFDMAYADKLFSPFQRLHKQNDFQGTGIGLAIVNRVIHRHGGHIWVESAIDQGTTFFFTLPGSEA